MDAKIPSSIEEDSGVSETQLICRSSNEDMYQTITPEEVDEPITKPEPAPRRTMTTTLSNPVYKDQKMVIPSYNFREMKEIAPTDISTHYATLTENKDEEDARRSNAKCCRKCTNRCKINALLAVFVSELLTLLIAVYTLGHECKESTNHLLIFVIFYGVTIVVKTVIIGCLLKARLLKGTKL